MCLKCRYDALVNTGAERVGIYKGAIIGRVRYLLQLEHTIYTTYYQGSANGVLIMLSLLK